MKRGRWLLVLVLGLGLGLAGGCGGSGTRNIDLDVQELQSCGIAGLYNIFSILERMGGVLDEIQGDDVPGVSVTPAATNQWDFSIALDLDLDGITDSTITGRATFAQDPTGGIANGDTATLVVSQPGAPDLPALNGTFNVLFLSESTVSLTGTGSVNGVEGCNVAFALPAADPLVLAFDTGTDTSTLAFDVPGILVATGSARLVVSRVGDTYETTLVLDGSNDVLFSDSSFDTVPLPDVLLPDVLGENALFTIRQCMFTQFQALGDASEIVEDVLQAIASSQTTIPGGTFTVTQVGPLVFDLTAQVTTDRDIALAARVTTSGTDPNDVTVMLTSLIVQSRASAPQGTGALSPDYDATGTGTITYLNGDLVEVHGSIQMTTPNGLCSGGFYIPSTNPIAENPTKPSRIEFELVADGVPFEATFILPGESSEAIVLVYGARIGGIPIPGNLLTTLLLVD